MSTTTMSGSRLMTATGLAIMLLAVSAGVGSGKFGLLLGLVGGLIGANLVLFGIRRTGEELAASPTGPAEFAGVGAFTMRLRCNLAMVGLILASSAITAVAGEAGPVLCCCMSALFLLGISLINVGILGA